MKKAVFVVLVLLLVSSIAVAQTISNIRPVQEGNNIVVYYDLQCDKQAEIEIYCSDDGGKTFTVPVKSVSGDVGLGIAAGIDKKIVWDVIKDKDPFYGNAIVFKVVAISTYTSYRPAAIRNGICCRRHFYNGLHKRAGQRLLG